MIKLVRVDHRLIHGQVAFSWTKFLGIDLILIPNDEIINDELRKSVLRMAKPSNVKLIIKSVDECIEAINSGVTGKYNMMVLLESVDDAYRLTKEVPSIKEINLGGMKDSDEREQVSKAVHLSKEDITKIKELTDSDIDIYAQLVPDDPKEDILNLI